MGVVSKKLPINVYTSDRFDQYLKFPLKIKKPPNYSWTDSINHSTPKVFQGDYLFSVLYKKYSNLENVWNNYTINFEIGENPLKFFKIKDKRVDDLRNRVMPIEEMTKILNYLIKQVGGLLKII
jgi:hypothetical protein